MRENVNKIDYAGFTFAGKHTSQFGLYSVSNGDRYSRYLSPTIKNQTAENTGGTGTYFFGSQHIQQTFNFNLAFDSVTELELREIKQWLNSDISPLILDETPYIQYYVKLSAAPQISFLPFDIEDSELLQNNQLIRVYKGELNLTFVAYDPYGYSVKKWLSDYDDDNKEEWAAASGLIDNSNKKFDTPYNGQINIYNAGNLPTDFIISFQGIWNEISLTTDYGSWMEITNKEGINYYNTIIDTKKRLIICDGKVRNDFLTSGDFFQIPIGSSIITYPTNLSPEIEYKYRYI